MLQGGDTDNGQLSIEFHPISLRVHLAVRWGKKQPPQVQYGSEGGEELEPVRKKIASSPRWMGLWSKLGVAPLVRGSD